jgi:hypothetical protein
MNLPSFASLRPANLTAAAISGVGGQRPPHISIDSNVFTLVDSTGNRKQLPPMITSPGVAAVAIDVVFIDANPLPSKLYWDPAKPFSPQSVDPPLCWSDNGVGPSYLSIQPQSPTCQACPHNVIGSAVSKFSGASIRACGDSKKLACVIPGDPDGMVYLMQIKPGSFKNWSSYINWLKSQKLATGGIPELFDVVTRLTFESQGVLKFEPVSAVEENSPLGAQMIEAWSKKITGSMIGLDDRPIDPASMRSENVTRISIPQSNQMPPQQLQPPPPAAPGWATPGPAPAAPVQPAWQPQPAAQLGPNGRLGEQPPFVPGVAGQGIAMPQGSAQSALPSTGLPQQGIPTQFQGGTAGIASHSEQPQRRTRRTKAEMEAARAQAAPAYPAGYNATNPAAPPTTPFVSGLQQAPQGAPIAESGIPAFLQRHPTQAVEPARQQAPPASSGLATAGTPSDDLKAKLAAAFALPTGK